MTAANCREWACFANFESWNHSFNVFLLFCFKELNRSIPHSIPFRHLKEGHCSAGYTVTKISLKSKFFEAFSTAKPAVSGSSVDLHASGTGQIFKCAIGFAFVQRCIGNKVSYKHWFYSRKKLIFLNVTLF